MIITNVHWGLIGEPYGQRCLYFELDGRPASAFWEQKQGIVENGYLSIHFDDNQPSHLPVVKLYNEAGQVITQSDHLLRSPWLMEKFDEMCAASPFIDGYVVGDAPADQGA